MLVVPMVSLTSCGKVSQYFMPVIIGGEKIDNGPFKNFKDVNTTDFNSKKIDYLPSNYDYYLTPQSSGQTASVNYAYAQPNDLSDPTNIKPYSAQWLSATDEKMTKFTYQAKDEPKNHFDSRNYNIFSTSTAISTIAANSSQLFAYMLYYQLHLVDNYIAGGAQDQSKLNTLYGKNLDFGSKGNDNFSNFLEYNYSMANLMSSSNSKIRFGQSSCNLQIVKSDDTDRLGFLTTKSAETNWMKESFPYAQIKDEDDGTKTVTGFDYVPFVFTIDNLSFSYYNPVTSNKSFLPNDWLITDNSEVKSNITSNSGWNKYFSTTGNSKDTWTPSLDWTVKISGGDEVKPAHTVPLLPSAKANAFVGLASYGIYTLDNGDDSKEKYPIFNSVVGIYPYYFLEDDNVFKQKEEGSTTYFLDKSKLDEKMNKMVASLTDRNTKPEDIECVKKFFSTNGTADIANILSK